MEPNSKKKKLRDYTVLGALGAVFLGLMYYIFYADNADEAGNELKVSGLNTEVPEGRSEPLREKKKAYEYQRFDDEKEKRMKSLPDYMFALKNEPQDAEKEGSYNLKITETPSSVIQDNNPGFSALKNKMQNYNSNNSEYDQLEREYNHLQDEADRLRRELAESERKSKHADQLAMVEETYKIASKYASNGQVPGASQSAVKEEPSIVAKEAAVEITKKTDDIVSTLSDELELNAPYNYGFNTAVGSGYQVGKNTIKAAVNEDQTVTVGQRVILRLMEPLQAGNVTIPRNHRVAGTTQIQGDRMNITIESIEYAGNIIPVRMMVYDTDGIPGIYCPGSAELDAVKEGAANIGSGLGSSFTFTQSAGQQVAMDLTRGVMSGASQYLSKKFRTIKVTLKSNYEVLLLPQKQ